ncbi:helix-turn-helix transcriptional regulator [Propionivibrio dicarboxylicus]|nr:PAS domain-containing protein [Propionivibrio dicarboxylicus]
MIDVTEHKQQDEDLRRTHKLLTLAEKASRAGAWYWDFSTDTFFWSDQFFKLYGLDPSKHSASRESWCSTIPAEDLGSAREKIAESRKTGKPLFTRHRIVRPDGEIRWIEGYGETVYGDSGEPEYMAGFCIDISERQENESALVRAQHLQQTTAAKLALALNAAEIGLFERDYATGLLRLDSRAARLVGFDQRDQVFEFDLWQSLIHPEDRLGFQQFNLSASNSDFGREYRVRHAKGHWVWIKVLGKVTQFDPTGAPLHGIGVLQDISEHKQKEQTLADARNSVIEAKERLDLGLCCAGAGLWELMFATAEFRLDPRLSQVLGFDEKETLISVKEFRRLIHPEDLPQYEAAAQAHDNGETSHFVNEFRIRHRFGHWVWLYSRGRIISRDEYGNPLMALGATSDISLQKSALTQSANMLRQIEMILRDVVRLPEESAATANRGSPDLDRLTRRQRQILPLIAAGKTSSEIASIIDVATATVVSHRRALMKTLGMHSISALTRFAIKENLMPDLREPSAAPPESAG